MTAEGVNSARMRPDTDVMASVEHASAELFGAPALRRKATSVYAELCAVYAQCDETREDFSALRPSPKLDRCLGRLVEIIRGDYAPGLDDATRFAITRQLCKRIVERPALAQKARVIRRIASLAEAQMEHQVSKALLASLCATSKVAAGEQGLREVLAGFPYTESYVQLVRAELSLLQAPLRPALREDVPPSPLADTTIAICGCGPLPLTGFMLQLATGARIVLIDRDPIALQRAAALVFQLERTGVIPARRFELRLADGGEVSYGRAEDAASEREHVRCDALLIASLVPHEAKLRIAERVRESHSLAPFRMIVRSAEALCALLAYEPVSTDRMRDRRLVYCGRSAPRRRAQVDRELLAVAHPSVLNTSELYYRADRFEPEIRLLPT